MKDENPYDDADVDSNTDATPMEKPSRGTASRLGLDAGVPENEDVDSVTITIEDADGSLREYELTDMVKGHYEDYIDSSMENMEVNWYEYWWEGQELVVEYEGKVRDKELRIGGDSGRGRRANSSEQIPRDPRPPWSPRQQTRQIFLDVEDGDDEEKVERFDEAMVPIHNVTRFDIQERANKRPMAVEDLFIQPWNSEEGQMPVNSDHKDGEMNFEVEDFREEMGSKDKTATGNQRGRRWNL